MAAAALWFWALREFSLARHHVTQGHSLASVLVGGRQTGSLQEGEALLATGCVQRAEGQADRSQRVIQPLPPGRAGRPCGDGCPPGRPART